MLKNINFKKVIIFFITLFILLFIYLIKVYITYDPQKLVEEVNYSKVVLDRKGEILSVFLNSEEEFHIKYDGEVPETLKIAVINYEDKKFYSHSGVDYPRILKSFFNNVTGGKKMGASTISMQVVKLLEPKKRTYFNKLVEVVKAYKLESKFSKEEILKIYLNNVPYGSNIVGYSGAIKMYFNKEVKDLSYAEAALLAVLPNSPGILNLIPFHNLQVLYIILLYQQVSSLLFPKLKKVHIYQIYLLGSYHYFLRNNKIYLLHNLITV